MANEYVSAAVLKATLSLTGETYADADVAVAVEAASRMVDAECDRRFYKDSADTTRYYSPRSSGWVAIDDLADLTTLATDADGTNTYATAWTESTHFTFEPANAETNGRPRTMIRVRAAGGLWFPTGYPNSVRVVGKFGWDATPPQVVSATSIIASRLLRRMREAPFGIVTAGIDEGVAMRLGRIDPDVAALLRPFVRLAV